MANEKLLNRLKIISDIKDEIKKVRALHKEALEEDEDYQDVQEEIKKVRQNVKEKKERVLGTPENEELKEHLKELRSDLRENKEILAQELVDYYKESGRLEIVDQEGKVKKIKFSARLVNE